MTEQIYPEPTVGALIFNPEGDKIFLMQSHKWHGKYAMPGGHIEVGETMEEALRREIKEETNLEVGDLEFLDIQEFILDPIYWKPRHFIFIDFVCRATSTDVVLNDEGQAYVWVTLEEAEALGIEPYTRLALERYCVAQAGGTPERI